MGNVDSHEYLPVWNPDLKKLDLTRMVDNEDFNKHLKGKCNSECLEALPNNVLEEISLYESLYVSFNCLTTIPPSLPLHLPHLNFIDLSHNHLCELPKSFGLFFHLKTLLLHHNRLRELPDSFTVLHKLEKVDLSWNKLVELPHKWGDLKELSKLNVSNNRLESLPVSLVECVSLRVVLATGNKCTDPPQDVCDAGSNELLGYIRKNFSSSESSTAKEINLFRRVRMNQIQSPLSIPSSEKMKSLQVDTDTVNIPYRIKTPLKYPPNATTFSPEELKDRIVGLLYGAVIGDALGLATEFMTPDESHFHYEETTLNYNDIIIDQHRLHWVRGQWTGTSDIMLIVLDSILQWGGVVDELDFAKRLKQWKERGLLDDGNPGYSTSTIISEVLSKPDFVTAPHRIAASLLEMPTCNGNCKKNSSLHCPYLNMDSAALPTALILGVVHFHNLAEVISNSIRICKATHQQPLCVASNVVISCVVAMLLQGQHKLKSSSDVKELISVVKIMAFENVLSNYEDKKQLHAYLSDLDWKEQKRTFTEIEDSNPLITLRMALSVLNSSKEVKFVLPKLLMEGGNSTVVGCLAGALLGFQTGFKSLPSSWVHDLNVTQTAWLNLKINGLLDMMGLP